MNRLAYSLGGLLYCPATDKEIARHILNHDWPCLTSVSLCLEDSIQDHALKAAEEQLQATLHTLAQSGASLPLLFVRVRNPGHLLHVHKTLGADSGVLTGYILPKFDTLNAPDYLRQMALINHSAAAGKTYYAMPIIESRPVAAASSRAAELTSLRSLLDEHRDLILNVRVGGNDFCHLYGLRRHADQSIYDIGVVRDILVDILNIFSDEYVVSGPVWEYYGNDPAAAWASGLKKELELDRLNGFIGKTAIHPSQLPLIFESLKVACSDYGDALQILSWQDPVKAVAGSSNGRMNEVKCHTRWAEKIMLRAKIYGIREEEQ